MHDHSVVGGKTKQLTLIQLADEQFESGQTNSKLAGELEKK